MPLMDATDSVQDCIRTDSVLYLSVEPLPLICLCHKLFLEQAVDLHSFK